MKSFTLVSTVLNERKRLEATLRDLERQTLQPSEIIITDAGSTDGTFEMLKEWAIRFSTKVIILQKKRCTVAEGRNMAIRNASHGLIVSTDFGCRFHPAWLHSLVEKFNDPKVNIVAGNFSVLEQELNTWAERAAYICANGYRNQMDDNYLPSSRSVAYYRSVWEDAGGYPEELTLAGDDTTFALRLKAKGYHFTLSQESFVYWLRPTRLSGYLREAKRYAIGDAESGDHQNRRNVMINTAEFLLRFVFLLLITLLVIGAIELNWVTGLIILPTLGGFRSMLRIFRHWLNLRSSKYSITTFLYAVVFFDLSRLNYLYWYMRTTRKSSQTNQSHLFAHLS